jgi:iron complex outermembrane receptor protein
MLRYPLPVFLILIAVVGSGLSQSIKAQDAEVESTETQAPAVEEEAGESAVISDELEEVMVMARRIEGSGGRGRAAAGRDVLDKSDQTDMEGFFDEIDGLSTLGGDGEGNAFSIDGLSPDLSKVTLDGQSFGEGRGNGGFGAGNLPPEMVLRVDVYSTPTASMEEGGAGGRVNLQMRNPVDMPGPSTSIKGKLGYVPDKDDISPSASFFAGRPSESNKFGYLFSMSLSDRDRNYGSQDISNWKLRDVDGGSTFVPSQVRNNAVKNDQGNNFAGLILGFKPRRSLDISGKLLFSQNQRDTENHSLQHRIERQRDILVLAFDERIATDLESSDRNRRNLRIVGSTREDQTDSLILGMDVKWRHEGWRVDAAAGYNTVENESDTPSRNVVFEAGSAFGYTAGDDGSLRMSYTDGFPPAPEFSTNRISLSARSTKDTNGFGGIDITRQLGEGTIRRIRFGGKIREMTRSRSSLKGQTNLDERLALDAFASNRNHRTPWDAIGWPGSDMGLIDSVVQESQVDWEENLLNVYDVTRRTNAAYAQADFRAGLAGERFLIGNFGARFVDTETRIAGFQESGVGPAPVAVNTNYRDILPSVTMRMRIARRSGLTLGAAKVMTHPAFNDLAPGIHLNFSDKTAKAGNPNLDPFRANQFLAEITWAPERGRRLSGKIVYRDVKSYFALGEEALEINDDVYLVTKPVNGDSGSILTASLKLDQNLRRLTRYLQNYAVSLSWTHNKSRTDMRDPYSGIVLPMPNTAEHVAKADLTYSKDAFAGKLSYQWRGKSLKSSFSESGLSVWNQAVGSLNLNLGWQLNENLRLSLDARNLLNEEQIQSTDDSGQLLRITERDRSFSATLRAKW